MPLVGRIAAGGPILAEQTVEDVFPLPRAAGRRGRALRAHRRGDSMIEAAICDGDWVIVRRQPVAENGDIVAAMIDGEATVKRLKREARPDLADAAQRRLRADPGRQRDHPGPGRRACCAGSDPGQTG